MDTTQIAIAAFTGGGFVLALVTGTFGLVIRLTVKWARLESKVEQLGKDFIGERAATQKRSDDIRLEMREDRAAANGRFMRLEDQRMTR